jgi:hypothetical protein
MKKFIGYLPLLIWATITSWGVISVTDNEVSSIWNVMGNLWGSFLDIFIKFWPYLLMFWWALFLLNFLFRQFRG